MGLVFVGMLERVGSTPSCFETRSFAALLSMRAELLLLE